MAKASSTPFVRIVTTASLTAMSACWVGNPSFNGDTDLFRDSDTPTETDPEATPGETDPQDTDPVDTDPDTDDDTDGDG
jgi:hypothetical protein